MKVIALAALLFCSSAPFYAQDGNSAPPSPTPKEKPAHLRVWSMLYDESAPIVLKGSVPGKEPTTLKELAGKQPEKNWYNEYPPGKYDLFIASGGTTVKSESLGMEPDGYVTVVIYRKNGNLTLEVLRDPKPGENKFPPTVRVFNFGSDRMAEVVLGKSQAVKVQPNSIVVTPVSEGGTLPISISLPDPKGGAPANSKTDVDMSTRASWSVVVIPDYRGKLRPRVSPDGPE